MHFCTTCDSTNVHRTRVPQSDVIVVHCDDCGQDDAI